MASSVVLILSQVHRKYLKLHESPGGGGAVLAPGFGTQCETDPESDGGDKQRQKSSDRPIPLNSGAVGHL